MARNRMIRPEFWGDEKLSRLPFAARLLYIALWNFSDDYGVVKGHTSWLQSQIFPYDEKLTKSKFKSLLQDLKDLRRILPFDHNGESFFYIPKFLNYQKINRPSKYGRNPECPQEVISAHAALTEDSPRDHGRREGKGREVKGREVKGRENRQCPVIDIVSLYHQYLPELAKVSIKDNEILSSELPKKIKRIWEKKAAYRSIEFWEYLFKQIRFMPFLIGQVKGRDFKATLFWITGPDNFEKIINGNYYGSGIGAKQTQILNAIETERFLQNES